MEAAPGDLPQVERYVSSAGMKTKTTYGWLMLFFLSLVSLAGGAIRSEIPMRGSVIFIHPDGAAANHWAALRLVDHGPDGMTRWDGLEAMGVYRGHPINSIASSSHAGATTHAYGKKVLKDSYGMNGTDPLTALSGAPVSILMEAHAAGIPVGIINSGHIAEPGTGVFAASHTTRRDGNAIAAKILSSGVPLILSGGEKYLLPEGTEGFHGGEGARTDGRNLITEAKEAGYTVVFDRSQLLALNPSAEEKVLGVFAHENTFNAEPEEVLAESGLPLFFPDAPTIADMTAFGIEFLSSKGTPFFLVAEEEGSDNFSNNGNARGMLVAMRHADAAIGHALNYQLNDPETLIIIAADSNAGNPALYAVDDPKMAANPLPERSPNGAPVDGVDGPGSMAFVAAPNAAGDRLPFAIIWPDYGDFHGGVIARAHGLNSHLLPNNVHNVDIYRIMYATLFGIILD